jgi:hypothetical protein
MTKMFSLRYPLLLLIMSVLTSFSPQKNLMPNTKVFNDSVSSLDLVKDKKRCGPFIYLNSVVGATVASVDLTLPGGSNVISVTNPSLPYYFGQNANGTYSIFIHFNSSMATDGLIAVVAQDGTWIRCKTFRAGINSVSLLFPANVCQEYDVIVLNGGATCP